MGYDLTRFINDLDEEFLCSICLMVLENGVQLSTCEHFFCEKCIQEWLKRSKTCPVDNGLHSSDNLKPIPRSIRNMLNKQQMSCDFKTNGCTAVIQLENLDDHENNCPFNLNAEVICDKGCELKITRAEYEKNCISHLAKKLTKLSAIVEMRWQKLNGIKFDYKEPTILEYLNERGKVSLAQLARPLTRDNFYFEIKILELGDNSEIGIGLANDTYPIDQFPGWRCDSISYHGDDGYLYCGDFGANFGPAWRQGDVIRCGIKFRPNVTDHLVVFFNRNNDNVGEKRVPIPSNGFFPTIGMRSTGAKIKFII